MKRLFLIFVLTNSIAPCADDAEIIAGVRNADDARVAAMTAADAVQLESLLADELHYGHSSVLVENKAEHIVSLTSRRLIYRKVDFKTREFSLIAPGMVLGKGRALVEVGSRRMIFLVDINFLAVWRLDGQRWRLLAWQSSRNQEVTPLGPPSLEKTGLPAADLMLSSTN